MKSSAGLVVLVLLVLWLGYYLPYRVRNRESLVEAHTEDRFSGSLRVLAVAGGDGSGATPGVESSVKVTRPLLRSGTGTDRSTHVIESGDTDHHRPQEEARRTVDTPTKYEPSARLPSARAEVLARRAAAARRRLALSTVFLVASIACWALWGLDVAPWYLAAVPTVVLLAILVLGHRAVAKMRADDTRWRAEQATQRRVAVARARSDRRESAPGAPVMPRRAQRRVTGRAVHGSQASTQMIPRVGAASDAQADEAGEAPGSTDDTASRDAGQDHAASTSPLRGGEAPAAKAGAGACEDGGADECDAKTASKSAARETAEDPAIVDTGRIVAEAFAVATATVARQDSTAADSPNGGPGRVRATASAGPSDATGLSPSRREADRAPTGREADREPTGRAWDPVPVPPPTYTMKPAAPQRVVAEVRITDTKAAVDTEVAVADRSAQADAAGPANRIDTKAAGSSTNGPQSGAPALSLGDEVKPKTETLGLDLNEILARRRVAGQ